MSRQGIWKVVERNNLFNFLDAVTWIYMSALEEGEAPQPLFSPTQLKNLISESKSASHQWWAMAKLSREIAMTPQ